MRTVGATLAISALLGGAVACGGKDGGGGSDGEREATRAIQPEAQEYAQSLILTLSDFPDGWRQRQADDETTGREEFRACLGVDLSPFTITGEAESDDFLIGEYAEVSSAADVFKSEQMASDAFAEAAAGYDSEEADACMTELVGGGGDDVEFGEIEIGPLSFTPPSGVLAGGSSDRRRLRHSVGRCVGDRLHRRGCASGR